MAREHRREVAALTVLGFHAVVAGALPQLHRSVLNGKPLVAGTALADTNLWQAEVLEPPADIPSLLRSEDSTPLRALDLAAVRSGLLPQKMSAALESVHPSIIVVDGETVQDLQDVADALLHLGFQAPTAVSSSWVLAEPPTSLRSASLRNIPPLNLRKTRNHRTQTEPPRKCSTAPGRCSPSSALLRQQHRPNWSGWTLSPW